MKKNLNEETITLPIITKIVRVMKITTLLIVLGIVNVMASNSYSQKAKISLNMTDASLEMVLDEIENQSEFYFLFNQKQIDANRKIKLNAKNQKIEKILEKLFDGTNVNYVVFDRQIVLTTTNPEDASKELAPILSNRNKTVRNSSIQVQRKSIDDKVITGTVTSSEESGGLPGVNVLLKGTSEGTITDLNGKYSLSVPDENTILVFSSVGFIKQEVIVGSRGTIDINLETDITSLEEIVVVGYGTVKKKDLTGAIVSLGEADITNGASINSVSGMLQGRAAGVEVSSNDGLPGQALNIVIRGNTSISNSNEPLYVVDGFPIAAGVSISPDDIESIDILKDAASAAIYGSRGSSGVVLITTKKGKNGKTEIALDGYRGVQSMNGEVQYLSWDESARIVNEQYAQGLNDGNPWFDAADLALNNNTNWLDAVTRTANIQNYTLRASGGDDKSHFSLSGNYFNQEGIFKNSNFDRVSLRLNADRNLGAKSKVGMNIYSSRIDSDAMDRRPGSRTLSPLYATLRASPGRAAFNDDGTLAQTAFSRDTRPFLNPIGLFTERHNDYVEWRSYANLFIEHNVLDNLKARINAGFDHTSGTQSQYQRQEFSSLGNLPLGSIDENKSNSYLIEGTLDYTADFLSEGHSLSILAGTSNQYSDNFGFNLFASGFPTDKTLYYNLGSAENQTLGSYRSSKRIISFFGRANYNYKGKLLLTATLRADGASQFGDNQKWGSFPSVSAAWRIAEEDFMSSSDFVSDLKFRVSYGITGNNNFSPYTSLARVGPTSSEKLYSFNGSTSLAGLGSDGVFAPNPNLKWETTKMLNFGIDFGFWGNRLFGSLEIYNSKTNDLIIDKPISKPSTGFSVIRSNVGSVTNNGIELTLGGRVVTGDQFSWTVNANLSTNDNKITQLDGENPIILAIARQPYGEIGEHTYRQLITGGRMGDFFGYKFKGVLQEGEVYAPQPNTTQAGSALYVDVNEDGIINSLDRTVIGNANPNFIWGFNNHLEFGGLYFDMFLQAIVGNDIFNFKSIASDQTLTTRALERYSPQNPTGTRPGIDWFANEYGSYVNDDFIESGSYMRLKNVTLGYNFNLANVSWISNVNLYVQGQNLLTFTDYTGYDPEVSFNYSGSQNSVNRGVDDFGFPNYKTYTLGLKLTF